LEAAWRTAAAQLPHEQAEIERARVDQQAFEDVRMPPQVCAAHPAGVVDVRERLLLVLPAAPQKPQAARSAHAAALAVDRALRVARMGSVPTTPIWLRDIGPDTDRAHR